MTRATWDDSGLRLFHTGVDRGMLYTGTDIPVAVPWNGLASVTEAPEGGGSQPYYLDGQKILDVAAGEDFKATIEAFSAPSEFSPCAGWTHLSTGLFATTQPKQTFAFSYRTLIGNDTQGLSYAYRVHVVYNATALVTSYTHASMSATPAPKTYSWDVTTCPVDVTGYRPTSHFIFDTSLMDVSDLEAILYGDDDNDPRIPTTAEIVTLLTS